MASASIRNTFAPPAFTDDLTYSDWKKEIEFWQLGTELKEEKQGTAVFLSLTGNSERLFVN